MRSKKIPEAQAAGEGGMVERLKLHNFVESMQEVADGIRAVYQILRPEPPNYSFIHI